MDRTKDLIDLGKDDVEPEQAPDEDPRGKDDDED
jgi:hypothetical protein